MRALKRAGLEFAQKGSHIYLHRWSGERWSPRVAVPFHAGRTIKPKTLKRILDQAGLSVEDLIQFL
jgi:predicted RNA binding protein YcfA (HicA-like mRNA interferase family)